MITPNFIIPLNIFKTSFENMSVELKFVRKIFNLSSFLIPQLNKFYQFPFYDFNSYIKLV